MSAWVQGGAVMSSAADMLGWKIALITAGVSGIFCWCILAILLKTGCAWNIATDVPNHRSLHTKPTPRVGGLGLMPACLCVGALVAPTFRVVALIALGLVLVSQIDDRRGLPARVRFTAHLACAVVFVVTVWLFGSVRVAIAGAADALGVQNGPFFVMIVIVFAIVAFVWTMNLYNFMDGMDGLAGGMACFGFSSYAIAAFCAMQHAGSVLPVFTDVNATEGGVRLAALRDITLASCATAGAALGFLFWNAPPAKLFLGDAGSVPLGFLAAALGWLGWSHAAWPAAFPFLVFSPFAADATVTLLRRLLRADRFWEAHREHYYQRMVRMGWSRGRVLLIAYSAMVGAAACALLYVRFDIYDISNLTGGFDARLLQRLIAVLCFLGLAGIGVFVDRRWAQFICAATRD